MSIGQRAHVKNTLICVQKMNEGLTGLEQREGEKLMTEFISFQRARP